MPFYHSEKRLAIGSVSVLEDTLLIWEWKQVPMSLLGAPPVPLFGLHSPWLSGSSWQRPRHSGRLKEVLRVSPSRSSLSSAHLPWLPSCHLAWNNTLDQWCLVWLWAQEVQGTYLATEARIYPQVSVRMGMGQVQSHVQRDSCCATRWSWALLNEVPASLFFVPIECLGTAGQPQHHDSGITVG